VAITYYKNSLALFFLSWTGARLKGRWAHPPGWWPRGSRIRGSYSFRGHLTSRFIV